MSGKEHQFESKAGAGASETYPQQAGTILKIGYIVIKGRLCKRWIYFHLEKDSGIRFRRSLVMTVACFERWSHRQRNGYDKGVRLSSRQETDNSVVDLVLIMSVNPDFGGQSFIESQVKKYSDFCKEFEERRSRGALSRELADAFINLG